MRRRSLSVLALPFLLVLAACASAPLTLDRVEGVYTTHFDGIPDQSRVCAVLTNHGDTPVRWVRLRLVAFATPGERRSRLVSHWVLPEAIAPGESAAVELENPPVVGEVQLRVQRTGRGENTPAGRPVRRSDACDADALLAAAEAESEQRTASDMRVQALVDRDAPRRDALVAGP